LTHHFGSLIILILPRVSVTQNGSTSHVNLARQNKAELDRQAERHHFPAIDWLMSYSLYIGSVEEWYEKKTKQPWKDLCRDVMSPLQSDEELREMVMLVDEQMLRVHSMLPNTRIS